MVRLFERLTENLATKAGIDKQLIVEQAFITPSCGTGSMEAEDARKVFAILRDTSAALKDKYGF